MIYEKLFENAYNAARFFRKKNLQSLLASESLATYESLGVQYISDEEYNDAVLPCWKKYGRKPQKFWFELYGAREKSIEPGFTIPAMDKIRRQVEMIHPVMAHFKWIGWDWTVDDEGEPVLIEFNGSPGILSSQMSSCRPVFGEMTEWILEDYFIHRTWEKNQKQGIICI